MIKRTLLFWIFCLSVAMLAAQAPGKNTVQPQPDTVRIKRNISAFTRLSYSRSPVDSILKYCGFPFYLKDRKASKVFSSRQLLKADLEKNFKKEKHKPGIYTIQTIIMTDSCSKLRIKNKRTVCVKVRLHMPDWGEGDAGVYTTSVFYVERKYPNLIVGIEEE